MINNNARYEIHKDALESAGLKVSSRLLKAARTVNAKEKLEGIK